MLRQLMIQICSFLRVDGTVPEVIYINDETLNAYPNRLENLAYPQMLKGKGCRETNKEHSFFTIGSKARLLWNLTMRDRGKGKQRYHKLEISTSLMSRERTRGQQL